MIVMAAPHLPVVLVVAAAETVPHLVVLCIRRETMGEYLMVVVLVTVVEGLDK
jgi:hypothetical protein